MWCCGLFLYGVTGESDAEFLEYFAVHLAEHDGGVYLATVKVRKLLKGTAAAVVRSAEQRESYEDFVGVEAGIASVEEGNLRALDRLNHRLWYELDLVGYSGKVLCCVEQEGSAGSEEFA